MTRLLACDFESSDLCGFTNGDYAWTRDAYGTPSSNTGPSGDHTTGAGYYMHVETSGAYGNPPYTLTSPTFSECVGEVRFAYHMYGSAMGTLALEQTTNGVDWTTLWTKSGDQGDSWQHAIANASSNVAQVRFAGSERGGGADEPAACSEVK